MSGHVCFWPTCVGNRVGRGNTLAQILPHSSLKLTAAGMDTETHSVDSYWVCACVEKWALV